MEYSITIVIWLLNYGMVSFKCNLFQIFQCIFSSVFSPLGENTRYELCEWRFEGIGEFVKLPRLLNSRYECLVCQDRSFPKGTRPVEVLARFIRRWIPWCLKDYPCLHTKDIRFEVRPVTVKTG